ncbi:MAG TPA: zf-HC2 domain-containing protein, partial [Thermoanaerobaculia bacterium]
MNEIGPPHPARSPEFLSRLHDGELSAGERARFEAHRAHCAECRRAAIEFEDALSLFRSTRSTPPRSDLAARILRKVQTTNRPRSPFPMRFRIDLGWAALLLTALFAVLITTPLLVRERKVVPATVIRVAPVEAPAAAPPPEIAQNAPASRADVPVSREKVALADSRTAALREERNPAPVAAQAPAAPARENEAGGLRARGSLEEKKIASRDGAAAEPAGAGGEGDAAARPAAAVAAALHVSIREVDGFGAPPALLPEVRIDLPTTERGREYLL